MERGAARAEGPSRSLDLVARAIRGAGEPLDAKVRARFTARMGRDPGAVRVHRDVAADVSARALGTVAAAVGEHVLFRHGAYRPATPAGRRLIDHELVHVLQARGAPPAPRPLRLGGPDEPAEREADRLADPRTADRSRIAHTSDAAGVVRRAGVSYELADAPYPTVDELAAGRPDSERGAYEALTEDERRVMGWLRQWAPAIVLQEQIRGVDRRSIAGAIAWEALENVKWSFTPSRAAGGPGKIHSQTVLFGPDQLGKEFPEGRETVTAGFMVEEMGLVPRQSEADRNELLKTPAGSIEYIGAIMQALAIGAAAAGFDIWRRPEVLCWGYNTYPLQFWAEHMAAKQRRGETTFDVSQNLMAAWVAGHLTYLELAVGALADTDEQLEPDESEEPTTATMLFATDSAELDSGATQVLEQLVATLRDAPDGTVVSIVGHADPRGTPQHNQPLSERRAMAVFDALEARLGPDAERLTFATFGRGESQPAATLAASRRVQIEVGP